MHCIFCKSNSDSSVSVEHIIPESLGNVDHTLPRGWVCDQCNNYLAREVEKPFLDSPYGTAVRFEMVVPNKRGRIPAVKGVHRESGSIVELFYSTDRELFVGAARDEDVEKWVRSFHTFKTGTLYTLAADSPPADFTTSRFIAKVALEVLAHKCISTQSWNDEIAHKPELDELRSYVRLGQPRMVWPVHSRRIYPANFHFQDEAHGPFQLLNEFMILAVPKNAPKAEFYAVIALFGIEYVINLGGPELDGFLHWLKTNNNRSPLVETPSSN